MKNLKQVHPVLCRINLLLISYLISRQARPNADIKSVLVYHKSPFINTLFVVYVLHVIMRIKGDYCYKRLQITDIFMVACSCKGYSC